jgi:Zn-dependent protease
MDFLNSGIPLGRYFGINVRLHFSFVLYALFRLQQAPDLLSSLLFLVGLYGCILLHEFGHALAARWADGEAEDILLWPLGGLAYCRPAWHPTAHLICTVAGPLVTLGLWLVFAAAASALRPLAEGSVALHFLMAMSRLNYGLLLFNLIPAFPMDGGRLLRDTIWHWLSAETATRIAVLVSRTIALTVVILIFWPADFWLRAYANGWPGALIWGALFCSGNYWLILLAAFVFFQSQHEKQIVGAEAMGTYGFSLRERLRRGRRQSAFRRAISTHAVAEAQAGFHRCATCGRTERDDPGLEFRVCTECADGGEYCTEHMDDHPHR